MASLLFRCFNLCSEFVKFHHNINILKGVLYKNSYQRDFVDKCIKIFLGKVLTQNAVVSTVPKKDFMIVLSYLGKLSLQIRTRINRVMKNKLTSKHHKNDIFQVAIQLLVVTTRKIRMRIQTVCAKLLSIERWFINF